MSSNMVIPIHNKMNWCIVDADAVVYVDADAVVYVVEYAVVNGIVVVIVNGIVVVIVNGIVGEFESVFGVYLYAHPSFQSVS